MDSSLMILEALIATMLVLFLLVGFAMLETGLTRAKNSGNIMMGKLVSFSLSVLAFGLLGYRLMYGAPSLGLFGQGVPPEAGSAAGSAFMAYQMMLCAVTVSIAFGAMAERLKFSAYCLYSIFIAAVVYPVCGHWINGGGWLSQLRFHDFAGSSSVQLVGGMAALAGTAVLGARYGKQDQNGRSKALPGHNLAVGALSGFVFLLGWAGFVCGRLLSGTKASTAGTAYVNMILAASSAAVAVMCITWARFKKPDILLTLSGAVAGLAAVSAGCDVFSESSAVLVGAMAGILATLGMEFLDKHTRIDDPVGVICMNGLAGAFGTWMVGLFSRQNGLFYGGGLYAFGIQFAGTAAVAAWTGLACLALLAVLNATDSLRVSFEEEEAGLDRVEHGIENSYADFMPSIDSVGTRKAAQEPPSASVPADVALTAHKTVPLHRPKITRIDILLNENRLERLKQALNHIGITGMTIFNVRGCGMQKGGTEFYRGVEVDMTLLPKVKVEVVVCKVLVETVVEAAKKVLFTGNIGDGKIFIYDVENVMKIRTDEEGFEALQDDIRPPER